MDKAGTVHDGAVATDNSFVAWMASEAAVNAALASGDVESGLRWSDRMIVQHRALRVREGPTLLELRADLLALAGDAPPRCACSPPPARTTSGPGCAGRTARSPPT